MPGISSCPKFCTLCVVLGSGRKTHALYEEEQQDLREGFFRAALTELVSIEDILHLDLSALGISKPSLKLNHTTNPLLHLFRELRNHEIHLQHNSLSAKDKDVLWGNI